MKKIALLAIVLLLVGCKNDNVHSIEEIEDQIQLIQEDKLLLENDIDSIREENRLLEEKLEESINLQEKYIKKIDVIEKKYSDLIIEIASIFENTNITLNETNSENINYTEFKEDYDIALVKDIIFELADVEEKFGEIIQYNEEEGYLEIDIVEFVGLDDKERISELGLGDDALILGAMYHYFGGEDEIIYLSDYNKVYIDSLEYEYPRLIDQSIFEYMSGNVLYNYFKFTIINDKIVRIQTLVID